MAILDVGTGLLRLGQAASGGGGGGGGNAGGVVGNGEFRVRFFDFDGTILKTQMCNAGEAAEAPAIPDHERLLFQEWNNDFDNITGDLDVGAIYTTKSGKCEFDLWITKATGEHPANNPRGDKVVYFNPYLVSGTLTIEWGDGSTETITTAGASNLTHTYPAYGKYTMLVGVSAGGSWKPATSLFSVGGGTGTGAEDYYVTEMRLASFNTILTAHKSLAMMVCCKTISLPSGLDMQGDTYLFAADRSLTHINLPRSVANTRYGMCASCENLRSIVLPQGLTTIERSLVQSCKKFTELIIPKTVTKIWLIAFQDSGITRIKIPDSVTIFEGFLGSCNSLEKYSIPKTVTKVSELYSSLYALKTIECFATTPPELSSVTANSGGTLKEIIVPKGCGNAYKSATNWSYYADIIKEEE